MPVSSLTHSSEPRPAGAMMRSNQAVVRVAAPRYCAPPGHWRADSMRWPSSRAMTCHPVSSTREGVTEQACRTSSSTRIAARLARPFPPSRTRRSPPVTCCSCRHCTLLRSSDRGRSGGVVNVPRVPVSVEDHFLLHMALPPFTLSFREVELLTTERETEAWHEGGIHVLRHAPEPGESPTDGPDHRTGYSPDLRRALTSPNEPLTPGRPSCAMHYASPQLLHPKQVDRNARRSTPEMTVLERRSPSDHSAYAASAPS